MNLHITKSKNAESFYICKSYVKSNGSTTSTIVRKLGTLATLLPQHGPTRDDVIAWAKEEVRSETENYKVENKNRTVQISFHADRQLDYHQQKFFQGGYLFLQSIYYNLHLDQICKKIKTKYKFEYDLNAILSDLIYTRILEPDSKRSSFASAQKFHEPPTYKLHDVYCALDVLAAELDFIQAETYKNSCFITTRNDRILYYDCTNYYFEIEQESGSQKYGKGKEHRPNPIIQMGLFMDGDGIPLAFSLFPGNQNEQMSLKPLEKNILQNFECDKFIYCTDAGLGSEANREFNHMGKRSFIVTQSIKKLNSEDREWALSDTGFRRVSDDRKVDIRTLTDKDKDSLFYKDEPYTTKKLDQRLIITYSPKYAAYQKQIRTRHIERAENMISSGKYKKEKRNPNDPARFVGKLAVTKDGEVVAIHYFLDQDKITEEEKYDGLYAICTDLLNDPVGDILKVSEGRWQIEACFRIMKTDFCARPAYVSTEEHIRAHFLVCFLALAIYRLLEKKLKKAYTCEEILNTLKGMNFADIKNQGYMPLYSRETITDALHDVCDLRTDYEFIAKSKMKTIQKNSKGRK